MIAVSDKPIHEQELRSLINEYTARKHVGENADGGRVYHAEGNTFREFSYEPFWHYEHAIEEYRRLIDRRAADEIATAFDEDLIEDGGRAMDDPDNCLPEYVDKRREGRLDPY